MIVFGVDPGTVVTGYGVVSHEMSKYKALEYGCIRPPRGMKLSQRYKIIYEEIFLLIKKYSPDAVSVESQFVSKNVQSAMKLGMARGMIILAATQQGIPVYEYAPTKVKRAVVGNGRAQKHQVQSMVQVLLSLEEIPHPDDAADALALALCHLHAGSLLTIESAHV